MFKNSEPVKLEAALGLKCLREEHEDLHLYPQNPWKVRCSLLLEPQHSCGKIEAEPGESLAALGPAVGVCNSQQQETASNKLDGEVFL